MHEVVRSPPVVTGCCPHVPAEATWRNITEEHVGNDDTHAKKGDSVLALKSVWRDENTL
jgi:hypothetical protein